MFGRKKYHTKTDESLMTCVAQGDQQAFTVLYHRYKDRLFYYFFRMLNNSEEQANDFLQELFLKIIEKPEAYNAAYKFSAWIFSVAANMCKNEYRRRCNHNETSLNDCIVHETEQIDLQRYEADHLLEKIFDILHTLGPDFQSVFLLRYREGFSVKEIAEMLELPEGTVKSRLHSARKQLGDALAPLKEEIDLII